MRRFKWFIICFLVVLLAYNWSLLTYGFKQAKGQYEVLKKAQPLNDFLEDPDFPDSLKTKIIALKQIKEYAVRVLDLPGDKRYNDLYDQKGKDILWVVTAASPFQMIDHTWVFPLIGEVSYKGFFELPLAQDLKKELSEKGLDTRLRPVGAWSTLGWFEDPLLSKMLEDSEAQLAEVVFHELIHDVVYVKDSTDFNENLASFFAKHLTIKYLKESKEDSLAIQKYLSYQKDKEMLYDFMNSKVALFDLAYSDMGSLTDQERYSKKKLMLTELKRELALIKFRDNDYADFIIANEELNNAHILAFKRYGAYQHLLQIEYEQKFQKNILKMLAFYIDNFGQ